MNISELTAAAQDSVLTAIESAQEWILEGLATTSSAFDTYRPGAPHPAVLDQLPTPTETIDLTFSFMSRLLDAQHDFLTRLVATWSPPSDASAPSSSDEPSE